MHLKNEIKIENTWVMGMQACYPNTQAGGTDRASEVQDHFQLPSELEANLGYTNL